MTAYDELLAAVNNADGPVPCRTGDPDRFFPEQGSPARQVRKECKPCPAREQCLTYALGFKLAGVWGGTSEDERDRTRLRTGQRAAPVALPSRERLREQAIFEAHAAGVSLTTCASRFGVTRRTVERAVAEGARRALRPARGSS